MSLYSYNPEPSTPYADRDIFDWYPTQLVLCRYALAQLDIPEPRRILDPGAGTGPWGVAARERWRDVYLEGVELRDCRKPDAYDRWETCSFVRVPIPKEPKRGATQSDKSYARAVKQAAADEWMSRRPVYAGSIMFDLIIGNPPFSLAEAFVRRSLSLLSPGGNILFLFPLNFCAGQARGKGLFREFPPAREMVLSRRPSFIQDGPKAGKTDAREYALYHFRQGYSGSCLKSWHDYRGDKPARQAKRQEQPGLFEEVRAA